MPCRPLPAVAALAGLAPVLTRAQPPAAPGVDLKGMDRQVKPGDGYLEPRDRVRIW